MPEAKGHTAVRASKRPRLSDGQPWQKHELFPTPPWATRALFEHVLPLLNVPWPAAIWEPAAGLGHMSDVLREYCPTILATDVFNHQSADGWRLGDASCWDFLAPPRIGNDFQWIITNPPFGLGEAFLRQALELATESVAFLLRIQWLETDGRYERVFTRTPPSLIAPFVERVPMCEGGYDPDCDTATMYAWFIWLRDFDVEWPAPQEPNFLKTLLIPPGRKKALWRESDRALATRCVPGFVPPSLLKKRRILALRHGAENA